MRNRFDEELFGLNSEIIEMSSMCEEIIGSAVKALINHDTELAERIRREGSAIDQMEREIESHCMKLLLHQQPVARDLRLISAALKMITDIERIGDQAEDIAEIVPHLNGNSIEVMSLIDKMANAAIEMVNSSIDAFVEKDEQKAKAVIAKDDEVDNFFSDVKSDIISFIIEHPEEGESALDLLMISKYLERIGDHAVNIAEWVIYCITGVHKEE